MIISLTWPESLFFEPESRPCLHLVGRTPFRAGLCQMRPKGKVGRTAQPG